MDLKTKVKKSLVWSFGDQIVSQVLFVIFGIFLARILPPSVFGVVSMVTIFTNFAALFIDMGFGAALIQKKGADNEHYSSVFWLNLGIGCLLYILFFFSAPLLSVFFKQPQLTILIRVICLSFIISSLSSIQCNLLIRELKFKQKVIINWISVITGYAVAFVLAFNNYGVWSVVWMTIVTSSVNSILYWFSTSWYPSFIFNKAKIKELSRFGLNVLGDTTVNYWSRNFDNFIIARVLGSTDLGLYTRAYSLMLLPLRNVSSVITKVMFPAFAKKQDDLVVLKKYYLLIIRYISLITFPAMIGLSLVSKEFVLLFFGNKWVGMIPLLSILSVIGSFQSVLFLNGMIYNSLAKAHISFRISLIVNFILIIAFTIGVNFGIKGMAYSYLIASVLLFYPVYSTAIKQINTTPLEVFLTLKGSIFATLSMAAVMLMLNSFLQTSLLIGFVIKIVVGGSIYFIIVYNSEKELLNGLFLKLKNTLRKG